MTERRSRLSVEELSARLVPSAAAHDPLAGRGSGTYTPVPTAADLGALYQLRGTADLAGLGDVMVTGSVHGVGFMTWGTPGGSLALLGAHGSVTVELTGARQAGFAPVPHYFHFRVTDGTGAYGTLHELGTVRVDLLPNGTFRLAF